MNKYKSDIAESAANMMQIPDTLEGLLQDIHGQKEVESPVAENSNSALPETSDLLPKTVGKDGNMSFCKVDKDILATFRKYSVGGYTTQTLVNAILRSFILHYKNEFNKYKITEKSLL